MGCCYGKHAAKPIANSVLIASMRKHDFKHNMHIRSMLW